MKTWIDILSINLTKFNEWWFEQQGRYIPRQKWGIKKKIKIKNSVAMVAGRWLSFPHTCQIEIYQKKLKKKSIRIIYEFLLFINIQTNTKLWRFGIFCLCLLLLPTAEEEEEGRCREQDQAPEGGNGGLGPTIAPLTVATANSRSLLCCLGKPVHHHHIHLPWICDFRRRLSYHIFLWIIFRLFCLVFPCFYGK